MSPAARQRSAAMPASAYLSIGEVLAKLRPDFPDVTISKIRFLESEGLIEPQRTASGYRKFTAEDIQRLRYILSAQRDQYLPLKVIREHLEAMDRGLEPPAAPGATPRVPVSVVRGGAYPDADDFARDGAELRLSRQELMEAAEIDDDLFAALQSYGLLGSRSGDDHFDGDAVVVAKAAGELAAYGLEPRHLRSFKAAADREAGLIEQVVTPILRGRSADARGRAEETTRSLAALTVRLHAALVKAQLGPDLRA
ncbi:MAG TPA: MerR family transcriptional regulator [Actinomycetes bacterium]|nr:MerR family transcriptional regulator [Actinomycetes bacterium]